MTERAEHMASIMQKYLRNELSAIEAVEFDRWLQQSDRHLKLLDLIMDNRSAADDLMHIESYNRKRIRERVRNVLPDVSFIEAGDVESAHIVPVNRMYFLGTMWFRYAAAITLILTSIALYYTFFRASKPQSEVVQNVPFPPADIQPGYNRAILTLSNGQKVELDSTTSETIKDGPLSIENNNGQLTYFNRRSFKEDDKNNGVAAMNTMTTPKGGQYRLTLADGTRVWLNAASSITYPTAFNETRREVSINGEAYFEVKENKEKPFIVKTNFDEITVLGTSFNVNAYKDEPAAKTSLLQGVVKVDGQILRPGQAYIDGKLMPTDVNQDVAWKNGYFNFYGANIKSVMRQLGRWYDVEIKYVGPIEEQTFVGELSRNLTLSEMLSILKDINIDFEIKNRTLFVK